MLCRALTRLAAPAHVRSFRAGAHCPMLRPAWTPSRSEPAPPITRARRLLCRSSGTRERTGRIHCRRRSRPRAASAYPHLPARLSCSLARASFPFAADLSHKLVVLNHKVSLALLGLTPVALVLSPSAINLPVDIALSLAFPFVRRRIRPHASRPRAEFSRAVRAAARARGDEPGHNRLRREVPWQGRQDAVPAMCARPRRPSRAQSPLTPPPPRAVMAGATVATAAGLLMVSVAGPGLTETVKQLWRPKPKPREQD